MRFLSLFRLRRRFSLLLLLAVCAASGMRLAGLEPEPLHLYRPRRAQLMKSVPDGVVLLFGNEVFEELEYLPFRQSNEFYYLTGWGEPNAALLLLPPGDPDGRKGREILFLPSAQQGSGTMDRKEAGARRRGCERANRFRKGNDIRQSPDGIGSGAQKNGTKFIRCGRADTATGAQGAR